MSHATPIVFVVDDDVSVRESLELLIQCTGWRVATFASAHEFLAHERPVAPSCLVLELTLPDLTGLDLQRRIASDRTDNPPKTRPASPRRLISREARSLFDPGHVDVGNEIVGVAALEHEHLDGVVGLGYLNEGDQIADQFGPQKIHGRGRNLHEQNSTFLAYPERLESHGAIVGHRAARGGCLRDDRAAGV
jgi:Response regulator receiver domain